MTDVFSFLAFILVVIALRAIKHHFSYGQKIMFLAQIAWLIIGILQKNVALVLQSVYLLWVAWSTDMTWKKEGYYERMHDV